MRVTKRQFDRLDRASKILALSFCWLWMAFMLAIRFATDLHQVLVIIALPVGFLPYLLVQNGYVERCLSNRVASE